MLRKIKNRKSVVLNFVVLYYTFLFLFATYFIAQFIITSFLLISKYSRSGENQLLVIQAFEVRVDDKVYILWNLPEFFISITVSAILVSILTFIVIKYSFKKNPITYLELLPIRKSHLKWFLYGVVFFSFIFLIANIIGVSWEADLNPESNFQKIGIILGFCLFGPFLEELLFRGLLLTRMNELLNNKNHYISIFLVSLVFSAIHLQYDFSQMLLIFIVSCFLCYLKLKSKNLWLPIIFHSLNNVIAFFPYF